MILALAAGLLLLLPAPLNAAPSIGGLSARPLTVDGRTAAGPYFDFDAAPGTTASLEILVANTSRTSLRLHVNGVDGLTGATSGTVYANRTDPVRETGAWLRPAKSVLRLGPGEQRPLRVQVTVPAGARPGDHVGAVALQRVVPAPERGNFAVRQVLRVAVAAQIRVAGPAQASARVAGPATLTALPGTQIPSVQVPLENTGELLCKPELRVELARDGMVLGTVSRQLDTLLPGDRIAYPLAWPRPLSAGRYRVGLALTGCGAVQRRSSEATLAASLRGTVAAPGPDAGVGGGSGLPWWALLIALPAAASGGYLIAWRRRRRSTQHRGEAPSGAPVPQRARAVEPTRGGPHATGVG